MSRGWDASVVEADINVCPPERGTALERGDGGGGGGCEDALPERTVYRDEGCELAPACLACPFPECRYEYDGRSRNFLRESRNATIRRLRWEEGLGVAEIAARFGISRRSVHRIVRRGSSDGMEKMP